MLNRGYSSSDTPVESIWFYSEMERRGINPNKLTFPFLLKACASFLGLTAGRQIQVEVLKHGFDSDVYVGNNLIHLYGSCKKTYDARKMFDEMTDRNFVSWNSIMTALVENGKFNLVFECFCEIIGRKFCPDETTMVVLLSACCGNLSLGKFHSQSRRVGWKRKVGRREGKESKRCLAQYGFVEEALQLFAKMMKESTVRPKYVTFLGVLCACSHTALVDDGYKYFHEMEKAHKIKPMIIHYRAMVDILGRACRLNEAYDFI
ncbi:unnamed protein product [Arabidopsis lyrata]|nr:unnamed protein product [Arabidopsis lyrata]